MHCCAHLHQHLHLYTCLHPLHPHVCHCALLGLLHLRLLLLLHVCWPTLLDAPPAATPQPRQPPSAAAPAARVTAPRLPPPASWQQP
ncbi:hypothetical protein COO60DRAFT_1497764 [Scenedesmus sp. NREL 46B-D3]|nr:hypothetical protein COO60DRAFT_1497764 [Scenedesmus sp. NREL 46B-D3]